MASPEWNIRGQYYETCSCDFLCPCLPTQLQARPTKGTCTFAMAFRIEQGRYGPVALDGLGFAVLGMTPEEMGKGNWTVGVIIDERASQEQRDAIQSIASGAAGGPIAALSGLVGSFAGAESAPIEFSHSGNRWSVTIPGRLDMAAEGAMGLDPAAKEPMVLENTGHPATSRFFLARAARSHLDALGFKWADTSGRNNGQYAPFAWQNA